jgi:integrase
MSMTDRFAPEAVGPEHACRESRIDQSALKSFARDERRGGRDGGGSRMPARPVDRCQRPWNKGLLVGQKKPLEPKHVWSIRVRLEIARSMRDLAIFNLAIDSKLRACDPVKLRLDDICSGPNVRRRATIVQKTTGRPVQFEISEQSRNSVEAWLPTLRATGSRYIFPTRIHASPHISIRQYARLVHRWIKSIGLESASYGHALNAPHEGCPDLSQDRKLACSPTSPRSYQIGEHRPVSRD